ncbi:MAG: dienelactone hydrolase family protein [Alphaproteobacteria bacterium]
MLARRNFIKGLAAGLPLAQVLADPKLAAAAAHGLMPVSTTAGGKTVNAVLALPETTPAPGVILVHEWYGLNDYIKTMAAEFAAQGYAALAVDLYDGKVADNSTDARSYIGQVKPAEAVATLQAWATWLEARAETTDKLGSVGWCFGGGWSLMAGMKAPIDAVVVYYGNVARTADELGTLNAPVLGHFATEDQWINRPMVEQFEAAAKQAGKSVEAHWYEAQHAFANPSGGRYDEPDAKLAWERTMAFFDKHLKD